MEKESYSSKSIMNMTGTEPDILNLMFWEYAVMQLVIRSITTLNTPGV